MYKKIIALVTVLAMVFAMAACGSSKDSTDDQKDKATTETTAEKVTADQESAQDYVKRILDSAKSNSEGQELREIIDESDYDGAFESAPEFVKKVQDFDYEIVKADGSDVTVKITTYPFGEAYKKAFDGLTKDEQGILTDKKEASDAQEKAVEEKVFKEVAQVSDKTFTKEVTFKCVVKDDVWTSNFDSDPIMNALLGGLVDQMHD